MASKDELLALTTQDEIDRKIDNLESFARDIGSGYGPENWGESWLVPWYALVKAAQFQFGPAVDENFIRHTIKNFDDIDEEHEELHYFLIEFCGKVAELSIDLIGDSPGSYNGDFDIEYELYKDGDYIAIINLSD